MILDLTGCDWTALVVLPVYILVSTWIISDLAVLACAKPCLPLPPFFTPAQQAHALHDAGAGWLLTDQPDAYVSLLRRQSIAAVRQEDLDVAGARIALFKLSIAPARHNDGALQRKRQHLF